MNKKLKTYKMIWLIVAFITCFELAAKEKPDDKKMLELRGADISYYWQQKDLGVEFKKNGKTVPLPQILKEGGTNIIRLRLWVNPKDGWNNLENTLAAAKELKSYGFALLLDLHYSDSWTDPGQQKKPEAWKNLDFVRLKRKVHDWTSEVLESFVQNGTTPEYVQVGNEINSGFLWPEGKVVDDLGFGKFSQLISMGCAAVRETCPESKIVLHIANAGNRDFQLWWLGNIKKCQVDYDVIGLSYYPVWHGKNIDKVAANVSLISKQFKKPVIIAETAYPWTLKWNDEQHNLVGMESDLIPSYEATAAGQKKYFKALCDELKKTKGCIGIFWWEPSAVSYEGFPSSMENQTWFDFEGNYNGTGDVYLD